MGKTSVGRTIAINVSMGRGISPDGWLIDDQSLGVPVAYFSLEEEAQDFGAAIISQIAEVTINQVHSGDLSTAEANRVVPAVARLRDAPLDIVDTPNLTLTQIARQARRIKRKRGKLGLVVIDYLQLMAEPPKAKDMRLAVGANVYGLKNLAKELKCTILLLSQLSRKVEEREDKRPSLADLKETGHIEEAADVVMFPFREEYYYRQTTPKTDGNDLPDTYSAALEAWHQGLRAIEGKMEIIIAKQRRGLTRRLFMRFNGPFVRVDDPLEGAPV